MARIELWNGDICELEVDAIVNAANTSLWMSTGVGGAIKRAGGDAIEFAAVRQAPVELGSAIVTSAGTLAARYVIHASLAGPRPALERRRHRSGDAQHVRPGPRARASSSLAFPALGTGVGGFPLDEAARIMVAVTHDELPKSPTIDYLIFALRGVAAYRQFEIALAPESQPVAARRSRCPEHAGCVAVPRRIGGGRARVTEPFETSDEQRDELVEQVAREIQLRGLTAPAVGFLEASRPYRPLGANAMLFFDPTLRGFFGGGLPSASEILADDAGIEMLIVRLGELDEASSWDA